MKSLLSILVVVLFSTLANAQKDTLINEQNETVEVWDVVAECI